MDSKSIVKKIKEIRKDQWIILLLAGVLALIISLPTGTDKESSGQASGEISSVSDAGREETDTEEKLARILSGLEGAGQVQVMITWKDKGERIVEKDVPVTDRTSREETGEGTAREEQERQQDEATVYLRDSSGSEIPYVARELSPQISGVLVLAQGADSAVVEKNITDAVKALFGLEAHKIKVMKMNERRG